MKSTSITSCSCLLTWKTTVTGSPCLDQEAMIVDSLEDVALLPCASPPNAPRLISLLHLRVTGGGCCTRIGGKLLTRAATFLKLLWISAFVTSKSSPSSRRFSSTSADSRKQPSVERAMSGPLRPQDPAEEFLLEQQMVLLPPHRPVWPSQPGAERSAAPAPFPLRKAPGTYVPAVSVSSRADGAVEDPAALVPTRLSAKERKLSRSSRRPEQVASGSSRMSLSRSPELNRVSLDHEAGPSCHANVVDLHRRVPSPEETDEWRLRKRLAREQKVDAEVIEGNKRRKLSNDATIKDDSDDDDEDGGEWCVICLQSIRDPTIVGECGHKGFCVSIEACDHM